MSEAHRHNLNRNRVELMRNVQSLQSIFEFLRQDYTLTEEMQEEIQVTCCSLSVHRVLAILTQINFCCGVFTFVITIQDIKFANTLLTFCSS